MLQLSESHKPNLVNYGHIVFDLITEAGLKAVADAGIEGGIAEAMFVGNMTAKLLR